MPRRSPPQDEHQSTPRDSRRRQARHVAVGLAILAGVIASCGDNRADRAGGPPSSRLVDLTRPSPLINALDIDPKTGDFLLTTNRGFYRIDPDTSRVMKVDATVVARGETSGLGTFLEIAVAPSGRLVGSGHPDRQESLPAVLGLIDSTDGGRSWRAVSRLGTADLHKIVFKHGRMYAIDAVAGALLQSRDAGKTFSEQYTPVGVPINDFDVDPANPDRIVAASASALYRSDNAGRTWKLLANNFGIRLAWPAADGLYRALKDGAVQRSADAGATWQSSGRVGGEPYEFKAVSRNELYLALSDGTILRTQDRGQTWRESFRP